MKNILLTLMLISFINEHTTSQTAKVNPPNVVIIFMDDMGYGDPECYNGLLYHTPNINKLAAEGIRFTNFYAAQAVCSASRAALLTGCYPNRIGISGALNPWTSFALNSKGRNDCYFFKKIGYATGMVGKWHLGHVAPYLPTYFGFDEYLGLPYSNDMWPVDYDGKPITDSTNSRIKYPPLPLIEGEKTIRYIKTLDDQSELTQMYTKRAVEFIDKNKNHPFFLYLAHAMVHVPIAASAAFRGKSKEGLYGEVLMEVDWSVGEIMKALDRNGVAKNTIVIFTSDNGPWRIFGEHAGNTGGLREGKGTSWEGGQREPCIMRWPAKIPAGIVSNNLAVTLDIFPTIAHICNAPLPKEKIDGVDIIDVLLNKKDANPRDELAYYYRKNSLEAVRKGRWKLVFAHDFSSYDKTKVGRNGYPVKYVGDSTGLCLYDLRTDPGETVNLINDYPEVVTQLKVVGDKYRQMLGDDLTKTPCKECREAAKLK